MHYSDFAIHGKNGFAEISKNLARRRSENHFIRLIIRMRSN